MSGARTGIAPRAVFMHGWGLDRHTWNDWIAWQKQAGPVAEPFDAFVYDGRAEPAICRPDRGYFTGRPEPVPGDAVPALAVCHSFGLHLLPEAMIKSLEHLVIVSGFFHFHPAGEPYRRRSQHVVRRMKAAGGRDPDELIQRFHRNGLYPEQQDRPAPQTVRSPKRLLQDLDQLDCCERQPESLRRVGRILILHGDQDAIVPVNKGRELHQALPNSEMRIARGAGHFLPMTRAGWCVQAVNEWMQTQ